MCYFFLLDVDRMKPTVFVHRMGPNTKVMYSSEFKMVKHVIEGDCSLEYIGLETTTAYEAITVMAALINMLIGAGLYKLVEFTL